MKQGIYDSIIVLKHISPYVIDGNDARHGREIDYRSKETAALKATASHEPSNRDCDNDPEGNR